MWKFIVVSVLGNALGPSLGFNWVAWGCSWVFCGQVVT